MSAYKKNVLVIGIGGTGTETVKIFEEKLKEKAFRQKETTRVVSVVFDVSLDKIASATSVTGISLAIPFSWDKVYFRIPSDVWDELFPSFVYTGPHNYHIESRRHAYMAFLLAMSLQKNKDSLLQAIESLSQDEDLSHVEVYFVASTAEVVGSGTCVPLALYIKELLRAAYGSQIHISTYALLALPHTHAREHDEDMNRFMCANSFAFFRELSTINDAALCKSAPAIRLGHRESAVGVLFDSEDKAFCSTQHLPFNHVYLQGNSGHYELMANELYTLACTDAGVEFADIIRNETFLRGDLFYSAVGSAVIEHPVNKIVDYLSWCMTRDELTEQHLFLEKAEKEIEERKRKAKEQRKAYLVTAKDYASILMDTCEDDISYECSIVQKYYNDLKESLSEKRPLNQTNRHYDLNSLLKLEVENPGLFASRVQKQDAAKRVHNIAKNIREAFEYYYAELLKHIAEAKKTAKLILPLSDDAFSTKNELCFVENVLKENGLPVHPITALTRLCAFRQMITDLLKEHVPFDETKLPEELLHIKDGWVSLLDGDKNSLQSAKKSIYFHRGYKRFLEISSERGYEMLDGIRTNYAADLDIVKSDARYIFRQLERVAEHALLSTTLEALAEPLDALIDGYRKALASLSKRQSTVAERKLSHAETTGEPYAGIYLVNTSKEMLRRLYERHVEEYLGCAFEHSSLGDMLFRTVCALIAEKEYDCDAVELSPILDQMFKENREKFRHTDLAVALSRTNVLEAIAYGAEDPKVAIHSLLTSAFEAAAPSLLYPEIAQKEFQMMMVSPAVREYWAENADHLGTDSLDAALDSLLSPYVNLKTSRFHENTIQILRAAPLTASQLDKDGTWRESYESIVDWAMEHAQKDAIPTLFTL